MQTIEFDLREGEDFIPLIQLLKATGVVTAGLVYRNGQIEMRKRAKIRAGETICLDRYEIRVI